MSDADPRGLDLHLLALDFAPSGIVAVDSHGRILLVNREIERMFGYGREELAGEPIERLIPDRHHTRHVQDRGLFLAHPTSRAMGAGRDLFGRHRDGSEFPVEVGLNPVRTPIGTLVFASVVDIRARKREEARFQAAVESSPSGMLMVDTDGHIVLVNRETERLFGYSREELIGQPVERLLPEDVAARHPGLRHSFLAAPSARPMGAGRELAGRRRDGSAVPVEIGLNPIQTEHGTYVLASIVDVSERRAAERHLRDSDERLRQVQRLEALGTLAGGVAHDLNNVLMAVYGYTELAIGETTDSGVRRDLDYVLRATERGRHLIRRILTFSRRGESRRRALRSGRAVEEAIELLRGSLPSSIEIRTVIAANAPVVLADETEIHQIVMNLASNAAHAMGAGGVLSIELVPWTVGAADPAPHPGIEPGGYARLTVSDDGAGMDEETRRRALEPFFTTKSAGEGTGLGLSVIHGIVRAQGGAIEIHSAPGAGTRVEILLPATDQMPEDVALAAAPVDFAGARALMVDDEPVLARLLKRRLEGFGVQVTLHTSSPAALEAFRARPNDFDILITDNTMPHLTGTALAGEVHRTRPDLPILMVSGVGEAMDAARLREIGVSRVLPKPHTGAELAAVLRELLGS
ncbi:MAG: PAS domain S-box protein [Candidatus Eisenbacteria bacterium]